MATTLPPTTARSLARGAARRQAGRCARQARGRGRGRRGELELDGEPWLAAGLAARDAAGQAGRRHRRPRLARPRAGALPPDRDGPPRRRPRLGPPRAASSPCSSPAAPCAPVRAARPPPPRRRARATTTSRSRPSAATRWGSSRSAFDELLADLREKRDMEAYVTELSRNLPEPAQRRAPRSGRAAGARRSCSWRSSCAATPRAKADADPRRPLERLAARPAAAWPTPSPRRRGQLEAVAGHRVLRALRRRRRAAFGALAAAGAGARRRRRRGLEERRRSWPWPPARRSPGRCTGGEQPERGLVGLPVQQLESLLREATPGELAAVARGHEELREPFEQAGYELAAAARPGLARSRSTC